MMGTFGAKGDEGFRGATIDKYNQDLQACRADLRRYFQTISCEEQFKLNPYQLRSMQATIDNDYHTQGLGVLLLLLALAIWPLFFVVRWISTGRWKKKEASE